MIVEWIGGPKDGECFEAPDNFRSIEIARTPISGVWNLDGWPLDFERVRFDIMERRNGKYYVQWRED